MSGQGASPVAEAPASTATAAQVERVGVILVHGIGEQRRFQHLDTELRDLIAAITQDAKTLGYAFTVDLASGAGASFFAEHDTWNAGPQATVRILVKAKDRERHLHIHEVWWADINEPYSLVKQIRFWLWGLSVWIYPAKEGSKLPSASAVAPPVAEEGSWAETWTRIRLYAVGAVFSLVGLSIGALSWFAYRLFGVRSKSLRVLTNYVSGVKIYNQRRRVGASVIPRDQALLDTIGEPPRVSIRRRMIRTIADVAVNGYDRWYVLAHSMGSVVAFNGLMESAWAWPGYLDERRWRRLTRRGLAGRHKDGWAPPKGDTVPRRPVWVGPRDIAYRRRIFANFRGFVSYGCPLDKFAAIWPARVPIAREPAFSKEAVWVNVFDPIDPVSGALDAFAAQPAECCPVPDNIGYAADGKLLISHLRYLTPKDGATDFARCLVRWLLAMAPPPGTGGNMVQGRQFAASDARARRRRFGKALWWSGASVVLLGLGTLLAAGMAWLLLGDPAPPLARRFAAWVGLPVLWAIPIVWAVILAGAALAMPGLAGLVAALTAFDKDPDDVERGSKRRRRSANTSFTAVESPEPDLPSPR